MWSYEMWMAQSQGTRSPSKGFDNPLLWNVASGHVGVSPSDVMTVWKGQNWCDVSFLELFQGMTFLRYFDYMSLICRAQWCIFMHFLRIAIYIYISISKDVSVCFATPADLRYMCRIRIPWCEAHAWSLYTLEGLSTNCIHTHLNTWTPMFVCIIT